MKMPLIRVESSLDESIKMEMSFARLKQIQIKLYATVIVNEDAPADNKLDAALHIAMLSGGIEGFSDSKGRTHRRVDDRMMRTVAMLSRWEAEDGVSYLGDSPTHALRETLAKLTPAPVAPVDPRSPLERRALERSAELRKQTASKTGAGRGARTRRCPI
ncbi:hypothetical protein [Paraburkholderia phosphatilytica]|uniref:hypothetical protein n=1 Tax=Paraburkholderia phosphatilytica TaxID=2282883 RepID=UPI000F5EC2E2|nr:hypothetical protein [Paraburkholderia phosphatilytica]